MFLSQNISFCFDPLALLFLGVIVLSALPSFVFSAGYLRTHFSVGSRKLCSFILALFILSMCAVVSASNLMFFLFAWELMSLLSYFLVVFEHEHEASVKAGTIYLIMTHVGTAFLLAAFLIMRAHAGSFDFFAVKNSIATYPAHLKDLLFLFLLVGFGVKAGIVPLHIWLPYAHPQAPSCVSSIMSGVMVKVAIYGIIRFIIIMFVPQEAWWGMLVLSLAGLSCVVGVIYAIMDNDIKKILAYSTVENIGIILLGIGVGMVLWRAGLFTLAAIAYAASLYHVINHSVFKGLLFLGAGSIYSATGTRDIEKLGGLIKRMPQTAICFLIASMAISAVPPLSGFVSEWLIFQTIFGALQSGDLGQKIIFLSAMTCLALTSGLAMACFIKAFGISFLGMPRSKNASEAKEVSLSMRLAMFFLAALTIAFGLCAGFIWKILLHVVSDFLNMQTSLISECGANIDTGFQFSKAMMNPLLIAIIFCSAILFVLLFISFKGKKTVVIEQTWNCGYYQLNPRTQYSGTAFSKPFRIAFSFFLLPYRKAEKIRETFYHVRQFTYETRTTPVFKQYLYQPLLRAIFATAHRIKLFQMGSIHWYLGYIFVTLLALIIFLG